MVIVGVALGLGAAFCQASSYVATRHFVHPRHGRSRQLLVLAHVMMGLASVLILPWIWPRTPIDWPRVLDPVLQSSFFYLLGQMGLLVALRHAEPSRVSPMLAFKLVILAGLTIVVARAPITPLQWLAIALCLLGTVALNYSGGTNHPKAAIAIAVGCLAYALSDWNIGRLVTSCGGMEPWRAFIWSTLICYATCGLIGAVFLPWYGSRQVKDWLDAAPFAAAWLSAMLLLFACFGTVGVLYGNILQSTRGLMSVIIGAILARYGYLHLEKAAPRHVFARRLAVAILILAAVMLYGYEKGRIPSAPPSAPRQSGIGTQVR